MAQFTPEIKKGSLELLVLALVEERPRHGYEIGKLIEARSGGRLTFALPTLYPALLRLEARGWIKGRWIEQAGERDRCFYRLTPVVRRVLARQRETWRTYVTAVNDVIGSLTWSSSATVRAASSTSFLVSSIVTISPLTASMPICNLRQDRRRDAPCFSTSHSPAPPILRPVLSTRRWSGPVSVR